MQHTEPGSSLVTLTSLLEEPDHTAVLTELQQHNSVIMAVYQTCKSLDCREGQDSPLSAAALSSLLASPSTNRARPFQNLPTSFQKYFHFQGLEMAWQLRIPTSGSSQSPLPPVPGDPMDSSGLHRNPHTCTHTHKRNLKIKLSKIQMISLCTASLLISCTTMPNSQGEILGSALLDILLQGGSSQ